MNVQDVIEKALAGNDGIPVTPVEHSSCEDVQIEKLASALNFIGANLESSFDELEKVSAKGKYKRRKERAAARAAEQAAEQAPTPKVEAPKPKLNVSNNSAGGLGSLSAPIESGPKNYTSSVKTDTPKPKLSVSNNSAGGLGSLSAPIESGPKKYAPSIDAPKKSFMDLHGKKLKIGAGIAGLAGLTALGVKKYRDSKDAETKTASVDDALYYAAQVGKQALLEKVAEDRINPAKISAGAAAPYSGEIMPKGENVFGGQMMPSQLVAMKAQKVRARINSDMKKFVNNVGDGYNLQGHLNKMNK
jgi:hypothetical protein